MVKLFKNLDVQVFQVWYKDASVIPVRLFDVKKKQLKICLDNQVYYANVAQGNNGCNSERKQKHSGGIGALRNLPN